MRKTPKSLRLQLALLGRTNTGKSTFLNFITGQDVSIVSPLAGTTTDAVEKPMELLPIGPVLFLDTAGLDDSTKLGSLRLAKTKKILIRADVIILFVEPDIWSDFEQSVVSQAKKTKTPLIVAINKIDYKKPGEKFLKKIKEQSRFYLEVSGVDRKNRNRYINRLKNILLRCCPDDFINPPPLVGDLMPAKGLAALIIPIDLEAPKGRLILPQAQVIRDCLDNKQMAVITKESEYKDCLARLKNSPDLVVCDSQVTSFMVANTPKKIKCTTFSILFSRNKGNLTEQVKALAVIDKLKKGDRVLIAESCSHHPIADDIGRVKIPQWLKKYTEKKIKIGFCAGRDWPDDLSEYKLVIHCGGCMITRREMLARIQQAKEAGVALTNYGLVIAFLQGILERVLEPFPDTLSAYKQKRR